MLEDKGVLQMDFDANKAPVEVIREGALGGTHFRHLLLLLEIGTESHSEPFLSVKISSYLRSYF